MPVLLIVAGLILLLAIPSVFAGAGVVGAILLVAGVIWLLLGLLAYRKVRSMQKSMFGGRDPFGDDFFNNSRF